MTLEQFVTLTMRNITGACEHKRPLTVSFDIGIQPWEFGDDKAIIVAYDSRDRVKFDLTVKF